MFGLVKCLCTFDTIVNLVFMQPVPGDVNSLEAEPRLSHPETNLETIESIRISGHVSIYDNKLWVVSVLDQYFCCTIDCHTDI